MSLYLQIGATGGPTQIASNTGWSHFGDWVESVDAEKYPAPHHLFAYGWCQELDALASQLAAALKSDPPHADVADTAQQIIDLLKHRDESAESCTVTDGLGPDDA